MCTGEVQVAYSQVAVLPVCGSLVVGGAGGVREADAGAGAVCDGGALGVALVQSAAVVQA